MNWCVMQCQYAGHTADLFALLGAAFQRNDLFRDVLEAWIAWYQCKSIGKLILDISSLHTLQQPVQKVLNYSQKHWILFVQ